MKKKIEREFLSDFEKNQNIAHKICRIYTTNQDDHNDLFQEITIQVWKSYSKFRRDAKFSTWMYRVALNTAISLYRKSTKRIKYQNIDDFAFKIKATDYKIGIALAIGALIAFLITTLHPAETSDRRKNSQ